MATRKDKIRNRRKDYCIYSVSIAYTNNFVETEQYKWITNNCVDDWAINNFLKPYKIIVSFSNEIDAMAFKLRWL